MNPIKKIAASVLAAVMLASTAVSSYALSVNDLADGSSRDDAPSPQETPSDGSITITPTEDDAWTFVSAGQTYRSGADDGFTLRCDTDVWVNAVSEDSDEDIISFSDIFNFAPDQVETVEGEDGVSYTIRTYSSAESVARLNAAFSAYDETIAENANSKGSILVDAYDADEYVEVMVVLEDAPVAELAELNLSGLDAAAVNASAVLMDTHASVLSSIEASTSSFEKQYDYTLLMNGFSGTIRYGELADLNAVKGVKYAFVAPRFLPCDDVIEVMSSDGDTGFLTDAAAGEIAPSMQNANSDMNTGDAWAQGYRGDGMTVAVIDTGIDLDHAMFSIMPQTPAMSKEMVSDVLAAGKLHAGAMIPDITVDDLYYNEKIPFQFDYADVDTSADDAQGHGSHVAGILAGNSTTNLVGTYGVQNVGVAPGAQLIAMKVFTASGSASMAAVTAALEDAILLGVDGANLSLGVSCGSVTAYPEITDVFNHALDAGLNVCVAAGNDATSTQKSLWNNDLGLASNPDIGTLGMPSTFDAPMTVASADNSKYLAGFSSSLDTFKFKIGANNYNYAFNDMSPFAYRLGNVCGGMDLAYEVLNFGEEEEYADVSVEGKLVLAKLSDTISIDEQSRIASEHGALGMILYPAKITGSQFQAPKTAHEKYTIPVVGMAYFYGNNLATGSNLANGQKPETLHINAYWVDRNGTPISAFSSRGTTNELTLKPEITGIGGSVVSAYKNGSIAISSGTSMASPAVCGVELLVRQYVRDTYHLTGKELAAAVDALLMSTAEVLIDQDSDLPYSPREQGAGLVNAGSAIRANAYIDADGSEKAKFELGDDKDRTGIYKFGFDVVNLSDEQKTYKLDILTLTESAVGGRVNPDHSRVYLMEQFAYALTPSIEAVDSVVVAANGKTHVDVTIMLSDADVKYLSRYFENGIYIEGFVTLTAEGENGVDLSAPFLGFWGDWTDAPAIEDNFFWDWPSDDDQPATTTLFANTVYTYDERDPQNIQTWNIGDTRSGNGQTRYGVQYGSKMMYWEERNAISPNGDGVRDYLEIATGLLRSVKEYRYIITDAATGKELYRKDMGYIPKAYYNANYDDVVTAGMYAGNELDFDWTSLENNQKVIVRVEAVADIAGNEKIESWEFPVTADYEAPISKIRLYKSGAKYYVSNYIKENQFVDYTNIYALLDTGETARYKVTYGGYDPAGRTATVTTGFSDHATDIVSISMDYAGNTNYLYVTMSQKEDMVQLDTHELNVYVGDTFTVNQLYAFDTNTPIDCVLTWKSDNSDVVQVKESSTSSATLYANAVGDAVITATNGYQISDSVKIHVIEKEDPAYAKLTFDAGENGTISGRDSLVVEQGYIITEADVPEVIPADGYLFKGWDKIAVGTVVTGDITFTAVYRLDIPTGKIYTRTDTIVPGEEYLIAAEYQGDYYVLTSTPNINNEVGLKSKSVALSSYQDADAIISDALTACEWVFSAENAGSIKNLSTGKYLSTIFTQNYTWACVGSAEDNRWTWDQKGHLTVNDTKAAACNYLSYGVSVSGMSAGFDLFEVDDPYYLDIQLFVHTEPEDVTKYTVTFVDGLTGAVIEEQQVEECKNAVLPEAPVHEGYTFVRWDDDGVYVTGDMTITAEYAIDHYTVTFVDGLTKETLETQTVAYQAAAKAPIVPTHEGYTFTGWDSAFDTVTADITVTAQYQRNVYKVTFVDWDDRVLAVVETAHGEAAAAPNAPNRTDYTFVRWDADFSNVTKDMTVKAVYVQNNTTVYYAITVIQSAGGTITGSVQVKSGDDAVYTIDPDQGYTIADVLVDGTSVGAVSSYTLKNVTAAHTITAIFKSTVVTPIQPTDPVLPVEPGAPVDPTPQTPEIGNQFTDMPEQGTWAHDGIQFALTRGLFVGTSATTFSPELPMTRGMLVTVLWRFDGKPAAKGQNTFADVDDDWYTEAIVWANENGFVLGVGGDQFAPDMNITRGQLASILYRYAKQKGYDVEVTASLDGYQDKDKVSVWAKEALAWAVSKGIMNGTSKEVLSPDANASRAEVAVILARFADIFEK